MHSNMPLNKFTVLFILLAFVAVIFIKEKMPELVQPVCKKIVKPSSIDIYKSYDGLYGFYHWLEYVDITDQYKKWADRVKSISLYDSMMFVYRGKGTGPLTIIRRGKIWSFKNQTMLKVKRL